MKDIIKGFLVIAVLAMATFFMMELPKKYYENKDEQLLDYVNKQEYDISEVEEHMNLAQKIRALTDEKSIVVEGGSVEKGKEFVDDRLPGEIDEMFGDIYEKADKSESILDWKSFFKQSLVSDDLDIYNSSVKIIQVKNGDIYSFELGLVLFELDDDEGNLIISGTMYYDVETGKILYADVFADRMYEKYLKKYYTGLFDTFTVTVVDGVEIYEGPELSQDFVDSYYKALENYYGMQVDEMNTYAFISDYYFVASPFRSEVGFNYDSGTMTTIWNYIYNKMSER